MGDLTVRRNRGFSVPRYQTAGRTERAAGAAGSRTVENTAGSTVSETLRRLMNRVARAEGLVRESRQVLRSGEGALAEVQERLARMEDLARQASGGETDRAALQAELERLRGDIGRMLASASAGGTPLFLDGDAGPEEGLEALLAAVSRELFTGQEAALPDWLLQSAALKTPTPAELLAALGLDGSAGGAELLAALVSRPLEEDSAAAYLAALYLGAVIAGGTAGRTDLTGALNGLRQLLEMVAEGTPPDEAVAQLTDGAFSDLSEFQAQFTGGTAPGLETFLKELLLSFGADLAIPLSLLDFLAEAEGVDPDLLLQLLTALQNAGTGSQKAAPSGPAAAEEEIPVSVLRLAQAQAVGSDLSGVAFDEATGELTVAGGADVTLRGTGQAIQTLRITGSGTVTLHRLAVSCLHVDSPAARLFSAGENRLGEVFLRRGAVLTLNGSGPLRLGLLRGDASNTLRLGGGAVIVGADGEAPGSLTVPVVLEAPASLAAQAADVRAAGGEKLEPLDLVWKTFLPGWSSITALEAGGKAVRMSLTDSVPLRLWLERGERGLPVHSLLFRGRDAQGRSRTRYAYLHWSQHMAAFQELALYPNPFTVTGGEPGRDWIYEEESHTLRILSGQVTAVSGGSGTDANRLPFSGTLALADGIGAAVLTLCGVTCRTSSGGAFCLGRENNVTLHLRSGSANVFESGAGCAGISLGDGTSLCIDCPDARGGARNPAGSLTAVGGDGGAGIGRDGGKGRDRTGLILIRGGVVTALGRGGGAGIGAGKHRPMGPVTILGGTVSATGESGGAGIGGALGAPAGDITIRGGAVTAVATAHAAAIGAGVQGNCGNILITGSARIIKALGGNPGADIGSCIFGSCGQVQVSGGADIGGARLRQRAGIALHTGTDSVTLPQFRLCAGALGLEQLDLSTPQAAASAENTIRTDRRWVAQIQAAYGALHSRLEQGGFCGAPVLRDTASAGALLRDARQSIQTVRGTGGARNSETVRHLLR